MKKQIIVTMLLAAALGTVSPSMKAEASGRQMQKAAGTPSRLHRATLLAGSRSVSILTILRKTNTPQPAGN